MSVIEFFEIVKFLENFAVEREKIERPHRFLEVADESHEINFQVSLV